MKWCAADAEFAGMRMLQDPGRRLRRFRDNKLGLRFA
jgi:hypothetical protein